MLFTLLVSRTERLTCRGGLSYAGLPVLLGAGNWVHSAIRSGLYRGGHHDGQPLVPAENAPAFLCRWVRGTETVSPPAQGRNAEVTTMVNQWFRPRARPPSCAVACGERERYLLPTWGVSRGSPSW